MEEITKEQLEAYLRIAENDEGSPTVSLPRGDFAKIVRAAIASKEVF